MLNRRLLVARYLMATRPIHANFKWPPEIKFKWEKNPKGPKMPGTHLRLGDPEDPELNQFDTEVNIYPEKGDKDIPRDLYRECKPQQWDFYVDRVIGRIIVGGFWAWVFYNLYWNYQKLTGHFYLPYLHEFTDEELGIPPDNAPDPTPDQYWGNHEKPYGTYR